MKDNTKRVRGRLGDRPANRPFVWGHRGAEHRGTRARTVENTIESFEAARAAGADGIELDVRVCATGEVLVFHDDDLMRLAGRNERLDALSLTILRHVRLGMGARIPTLDEVFEALGQDFLINVEIKSVPVRRTGAVVSAVLACIERHNQRERVIVSSFDPPILGQVRLRAPRVPTALLFHAKQARPLREAWLAEVLRPAALHPDQRLAVPENVSAWQRRGYMVNVWTVNEVDAMRRVAGLGVDALITDDPAAAMQALQAAVG